MRILRSIDQGLVDAIIVVVFLALAAWFWAGPYLAEVPPTPVASVTDADISTDPIRHIQSDRPVVPMGGFQMNCVECHGLFESGPDTPRRLMQHRNIVLDHGLNDSCFNCHDHENRNRLALRGGRTVPFTMVARLCAKCHGPTYRDWQKGMHGRSMGDWDPRKTQRRLKCSECHDPHAPAFDPIRPLPPPNTLRMGGRGPDHGDHEKTDNPLEKWSWGLDRSPETPATLDETDHTDPH